MAGGGPSGGGAVVAHVVVADLEPAGGMVELDEEDAHHLASVLRLRAGEAVGATDGRGGYRRCRYAGRGLLEPEGPATFEAPPAPVLTVAFAPVKGDRPEWAVQKLAELGVDRIVLIEAERSVVRWDERRAGGHLERLRRVARSAVMQSRQCWLPEVAGVVPLGALLGAPANSADGGVAMADMGGRPPWAGLHTVVIGPEGGWSPAERAAAPAVVGLGGPVLRAETAAVAAGVLLSALRAGVVAPA